MLYIDFVTLNPKQNPAAGYALLSWSSVSSNVVIEDGSHCVGRTLPSISYHEP